MTTLFRTAGAAVVPMFASASHSVRRRGRHAAVGFLPCQRRSVQGDR